MLGMSGISGMLGIPGITLTFGIQPKSSATSVAFLVSLPRRYSICTVSPGSSLRASCTSLVPGPDSSSSSALSSASAVPLNLVMMSPTLSPAFAAGPPGVTPSIFAPSLSAWESGWVFTTTPIRPRLSSAKTTTPDGGGERRGAAARHPPVGIVALQLLLERRRLLLHAGELGGVDGLRPERPEHEEPGERRSRSEARDAPPLAAPAPLGQNGVPHHGPAVPRRTPRRQRFQLRNALVQRFELRAARPASRRVLPRPRGPFSGNERQQVVHRAVHHRPTPSSSIPRSRAWARASCDLEKLTVLPICSAISSWV